MAKLMKFKTKQKKKRKDKKILPKNDQIIFNSHVFCKTTFFFKNILKQFGKLL